MKGLTLSEGHVVPVYETGGSVRAPVDMLPNRLRGIVPSGWLVASSWEQLQGVVQALDTPDDGKEPHDRPYFDQLAAQFGARFEEWRIDALQGTPRENVSA